MFESAGDKSISVDVFAGICFVAFNLTVTVITVEFSLFAISFIIMFRLYVFTDNNVLFVK